MIGKEGADTTWAIDVSYHGTKQTAHVIVNRETITLNLPDDWPYLDWCQAKALAAALEEAAVKAAAAALRRSNKGTPDAERP